FKALLLAKGRLVGGSRSLSGGRRAGLGGGHGGLGGGEAARGHGAGGAVLQIGQDVGLAHAAALAAALDAAQLVHADLVLAGDPAHQRAVEALAIAARDVEAVALDRAARGFALGGRGGCAVAGGGLARAAL